MASVMARAKRATAAASQPVGLGATALELAKSLNPTRIDQANFKSCDGKGTDQALGIWPDRLQDDAANAFMRQPFENGSNAVGRIGYTKRLA